MLPRVTASHAERQMMYAKRSEAAGNASTYAKRTPPGRTLVQKSEARRRRLAALSARVMPCVTNTAATGQTFTTQSASVDPATAQRLYPTPANAFFMRPSTSSDNDVYHSTAMQS